ncbi:hypothetical protein PInf_001536 [Phytophthora infestans]|nr:hypothetical protein PInf_001536 [Phytophthora infestans]
MDRNDFSHRNDSQFESVRKMAGIFGMEALQSLVISTPAEQLERVNAFDAYEQGLIAHVRENLQAPAAEANPPHPKPIRSLCLKTRGDLCYPKPQRLDNEELTRSYAPTSTTPENSIITYSLNKRKQKRLAAKALAAASVNGPTFEVAVANAGNEHQPQYVPRYVPEYQSDVAMSRNREPSLDQQSYAL